MDFSIVIPTYNRTAPLDVCLSSLAALEYPRDKMEVIVADDGSPNPPVAVVEKYAKVLPVRLLQLPHRGPAKARNAGAAAASGTHLFFLDDDCAAAPDLLTVFQRWVSADPPRALGGLTINVLTDNVYSVASQELLAYVYEYHNRFRPASRFFATCNLVVPRETFQAIGGFDETFPMAGGEDREICERWTREGRSLIYVPEAIIHHRHPLSFRKFMRQHFTYGRGARHLKLARRRRGVVRLPPERHGFYSGLLMYPFTRNHGVRAPYIALLFVLSQLMGAVGYFRERLAPAS